MNKDLIVELVRKKLENENFELVDLQIFLNGINFDCNPTYLIKLNFNGQIIMGKYRILTLDELDTEEDMADEVYVICLNMEDDIKKEVINDKS